MHSMVLVPLCSVLVLVSLIMGGEACSSGEVADGTGCDKCSPGYKIDLDSGQCTGMLRVLHWFTPI